LVVVTLVDALAPGRLRSAYLWPVGVAGVLGLVSALTEAGWTAPGDLLNRTGLWDNSTGWIVPALIALGIGLARPEIAAAQAKDYAEMYEPREERRVGESRGADSDVAMFGHYLSNNTGIGLRVVAGGALLGIGVFVALILNGWLFGIVSAHMIILGYANVTFFPFVIAHAAFEMTAIVFSGACGLALARGLFIPGRQRRGDAVRELLQRFFPILVAVVLLFFVAALVEAFWSAIWLPPALKYLCGTACWALVVAYFCLAGRGYAATFD